jgi:O-glycosyl hydrolase
MALLFKLFRVLRICLLVLGFTTLLKAQVTVTVDGSTTYQTIRGWGGNTYSWILNGWNGWTDERVYEIAFGELGTTHLRMVAEFKNWELQNDDNDPEHFNWTYFESRFQASDNKAKLVQSDFNMMDKIVNEFEDHLMIGIWDVPNWMVSDSTKKDQRDLPYSMHAEFAESVAAYLLWARDQRGINIPQVILANEPDGFQVEYSPEELRDLIKTVGAKFVREGIETKIVAPDLASPYYDPEIWISTLLEDSTAASYLGAISYHTYYVSEGPDRWNDEFTQIARLASAKGLEVYFTEVGTTPWNIPNTTWSWAFDCMQMWHNILTYGNASLGYQWALLGRDHVVNPNGTRNPIFYALRQFFQHIPTGAVRIQANSDHRDLLVTAFKDSVQNKAVFVIINRFAEELVAFVNVQNLNLNSLEGYRTSAGENHVSLSKYPVKNNSLKLIIPSQAVVTLEGAIVQERDTSPPTPPKGVTAK